MNYEVKIMDNVSIDIEENLMNNRDIKKLNGEKNWCECYASKFEDIDQMYVFKFLYKERYYSIEYYFKNFNDGYRSKYGLNVCFYKNDNFISKIYLSLKDINYSYIIGELKKVLRRV